MLNVQIRPVREQDYLAVNDLTAQLGYNLPADLTLANIRHILTNSDEHILVACLEDKVIGWIQVSCFVRLESGPLCEIVGLIVDGQHRSQGVGQLLVRHAMHWSGQKHCRRLRVRSNAVRTATHAFYLHAGFSEIKEQKVFEKTIDVP